MQEMDPWWFSVATQDKQEAKPLHTPSFSSRSYSQPDLYFSIFSSSASFCHVTMTHNTGKIFGESFEMKRLVKKLN